MSRFLLRWALMVLALIAAGSVTQLLMKGFTVKADSAGDIFRLFLGVAVLSVLNATIGRLLKFLAIPLNCLTLGLFALVINAAMFQAAGSVGLGFHVDSFWAALVGSILFSFISGFLNQFLPEKDRG